MRRAAARALAAAAAPSPRAAEPLSRLTAANAAAATRCFSAAAVASARAFVPSQHLSHGASSATLSLPFALRHVRHDSTRAAAQPAVDAAAGLQAALAPVSASPGSEVASIAADSNAAVAGLQQLLEWIHVTADLPWRVALRVRAARARA